MPFVFQYSGPKTEDALLIHCIIATCVKEDAAALQKQQAKEMKAAKKKKAAEKEVKMRLEKVAGWQKDQQHLEET